MKGIQFRLYTENVNTTKIRNRAETIGLSNCTYYETFGRYKGIDESTLIIEYITEVTNEIGLSNIRGLFRDIADYCKMINSQECVLLTEQPINFELY